MTANFIQLTHRVNNKSGRPETTARVNTLANAITGSSGNDTISGLAGMTF